MPKNKLKTAIVKLDITFRGVPLLAEITYEIPLEIEAVKRQIQIGLKGFAQTFHPAFPSEFTKEGVDE